jgi:hypothetical protein
MKLVNYCIWSITLRGIVTWKPRKVNEKYPKYFEVYFWRRMGKIIWTDRVQTEEILHGVKKGRNILHTLKQIKAKWIGSNVCINCLLNNYIEEKNEKKGRGWRRHKQLLEGLKTTLKILERQRESTRWHMLENILWKRRWACSQTDYKIN